MMCQPRKRETSDPERRNPALERGKRGLGIMNSAPELQRKRSNFSRARSVHRNLTH